jgi:N-acetylneuraminate epimerase
MIRCVVSMLVMTLAVSVPGFAEDSWRPLSSLPDREGFAGSFAGVSHDALLVAGGANFPDKSPAEGGLKVWYDKVFVLESPNGQWQTAGTLPRPLGYGISVSHRDGIVCVGGSDAQRHYADAFRLEWRGGRLHITDLPSLPIALANACGALVGNTLYIVGGQATPNSAEALRTGWQMDLSATTLRWQAMPELPGQGRILAVAAASQDALWIAGGAALNTGIDGKPSREYLVDAYGFEPAVGWRRVTDLPRPVTAAASPAPSNEAGFAILGGDDGAQVGIASAQHQGFSNQVLRYDASSDRWDAAGLIPAPRVTLPCVRWHDRWVLPSGERIPGKRSPEVWSWSGEQSDE